MKKQKKHKAKKMTTWPNWMAKNLNIREKIMHKPQLGEQAVKISSGGQYVISVTHQQEKMECGKKITLDCYSLPSFFNCIHYNILARLTS